MNPQTRSDLWELSGTLAVAIVVVLFVAFLIMGGDSLDAVVFGR